MDLNILYSLIIFLLFQVTSEFQMARQFAVDIVQTVMQFDSTNNTNPMTNENTYSTADASRQFNSITYHKGASIIRMIRHMMGELEFQTALRNYLHEL